MKKLTGSIEVTIWKGVRRTLTREMVESAARKIVREDHARPIKKYIVSVAGEDFPPKKLITEALGVTPDLFDAHAATRWMRALGYEVRDEGS